jgi:peroxiredoxin
MWLQVGAVAPDFKLQSVIGKKHEEFQLSAYRGRKNVVILFYALDFTPVCSAELPPFQAGLPKLAEQDAVAVGICTDTVFSHAAFQDSLGGLGFPLASDRWPYAETATAYGVFPPRRHEFASVNDRAVFIVDKKGTIAWSKVYDLADVPSVEEILDALKKLA